MWAHLARDGYRRGHWWRVRAASLLLLAWLPGTLPEHPVLLAMTGLWLLIMPEVEETSPPRLLGLLELPQWGSNGQNI